MLPPCELLIKLLGSDFMKRLPQELLKRLGIQFIVLHFISLYHVSSLTTNVE